MMLSKKRNLRRYIHFFRSPTRMHLTAVCEILINYAWPGHQTTAGSRNRAPRKWWAFRLTGKYHKRPVTTVMSRRVKWTYEPKVNSRSIASDLAPVVVVVVVVDRAKDSEFRKTLRFHELHKYQSIDYKRRSWSRSLDKILPISQAQIFNSEDMYFRMYIQKNPFAFGCYTTVWFD